MNAKSDCEALLNAVLPFAEKMLRKHGAFFPYGGAMLRNEEIISIGGYDGRERPPSLDLIHLIKSGFVEAANDGRYRATALAYDVRVAGPDDTRKKDAVAVSLNHCDGYSVIVIFPYTLHGDEFAFDEAFAQAGERDIFPIR